MTDHLKSEISISAGDSADDRHISRRGFLEKSLCGAALAGATTLPAWAPIGQPQLPGELHRAQGQKKLTKASVRYQDNPKGSQQCSGCTQFRPPGDCQIVEGPINPQGWCVRFTAKGGGRQGGSSGAGSPEPRSFAPGY